MQVETVDDYDEYCHYVAGLVGLGLSKLFHASGKEALASDYLSNSMGLFLQVQQQHMVELSCDSSFKFVPESLILFLYFSYVFDRKQISFEII